MVDLAERLLSLPAAALHRRMKRLGTSRGPYKKVPRPVRSRIELVEYIRENRIKTKQQLLSFRSDTDPHPYDYQKEFESWSAAMSYIWESTVEGFDRRYAVKAVIEFNLWSFHRYNKARQKCPDVFPSLYAIEKEFGSWTAFKQVARAYSFKETMDLYIRLTKYLGRTPTRKDCKQAQVDIDKAVKLMGSKKKLDEFINSMEVI
jgi:hypothetical protein